MSTVKINLSLLPIHRYSAKFEGIKLVHYSGAIGSDCYLCGLSMSSDEDMGIEEGLLTDKAVSCNDCLRVVRHIAEALKDAAEIPNQKGIYMCNIKEGGAK